MGGSAIEGQILQDNIKRIREALDAALVGGCRIDTVSVSRTETRQMQNFAPNAYFLSMNLNFTTLWDIVESIVDPEERAKATSKVKEHMHGEIMRKEAYISTVLLHMQLKDDQPKVWKRDPENPAVRARKLSDLAND